MKKSQEQKSNKIKQIILDKGILIISVLFIVSSIFLIVGCQPKIPKDQVEVKLTIFDGEKNIIENGSLILPKGSNMVHAIGYVSENGRYDIEYITGAAFGITRINDLKSNDDFVWNTYINDKKINDSEYEFKNEDFILIKYEKVN